MEPLGLELKKARDARGITLRDMAARTKISTTALESLERDDFSRLPGGIFGRAFVRAYAVEVGLDPDEVVSRFAALLEKAEREAAERRAATQPEITLDDRQFLERQQRALLALRIVLVLTVIAVLVLGGWQVRAYLRRRAAAAVVPTPSTAPATSGAGAVSAIAPAATDSSPTVTQPTPAPAADGATTSAAAAAAIVADFEFSGECWVTVAVDGRAPSTRLFQAGERQRVEADQEILIDVGNAGAVRLTLNGKAAKPLGKDGAHERTRLTRDNLTAFLP
jgi:cytoskeleton protein RodZ